MYPHIVRQGESLATLAARHLVDPAWLWNEDHNADLRALRADPYALAACDVIYLPEATTKWVPIQVGSVNRFVGQIPLMHVSLRCVGPDGTPLAGQAFALDGVSPPVTGTTDGEGVASLSFPASMASVNIRFAEAKLVLVARVAHLDPTTERSGVEQRLLALGLLRPAPPASSPEAQQIIADEYFAAALLAFQRQQGIAETGVVDDATSQALADAHGA